MSTIAMMTVRDLDALEQLRRNWKTLYRRELALLCREPPQDGSRGGWIALICRAAERRGDCEP